MLGSVKLRPLDKQISLLYDYHMSNCKLDVVTKCSISEFESKLLKSSQPHS